MIPSSACPPWQPDPPGPSRSSWWLPKSYTTLWDTTWEGALRIAEKIHAEVSTLAIGSAGIGAGAVTVSIGLASTGPTGTQITALMDLYRLADGALYNAKAGGRNQTRCAMSQNIPAASQARLLQVVRHS